MANSVSGNKEQMGQLNWLVFSGLSHQARYGKLNWMDVTVSHTMPPPSVYTMMASVYSVSRHS